MWKVKQGTTSVMVLLMISVSLCLIGKAEVGVCKVRDANTVVLDGLPTGWKLDYDDGRRPDGRYQVWAVDMASNLAEFRAVPIPVNEYDESWKEETLDFLIRSAQGEYVAELTVSREPRNCRIILAPAEYRVLYHRARPAPGPACPVIMNRVEFAVDLSRPGMYQLKFHPKLETSKSFGPGEYPPATCTGTAIDNKGNPVDGAKVLAYEMFNIWPGIMNLRCASETITKTDGSFSLEMTPSVRKRSSEGVAVVAAKEGLALGWAHWWPLYGVQQRAITLGTPMRLAGVVVDEDGGAVPQAEVGVFLFKKKGSEEQQIEWLPGIRPLRQLLTKTDANGRFQFINIPENVRADLLVKASGFSTLYTRDPEDPPPPSGYSVGRFAANETDIRVVLSVEARIEGKVVDKNNGQPVAGAKLSIVPSFSGNPHLRSVCVTDKHGVFTIGGLQTGKYLIRGEAASESQLKVQVESGQTAREVIIDWPHVGL